MASETCKTVAFNVLRLRRRHAAIDDAIVQDFTRALFISSREPSAIQPGLFRQANAGIRISPWSIMTHYVIAEPCNSRKDTNCLDVCPVDAIHPNRKSPDFTNAAKLHINAMTCIGCGSCFRVCAAQAIFSREELPASYEPYDLENLQYFQLARQERA